MAFGNLKRKDLDQDFLNYLEVKWNKYEYAKNKANKVWPSVRYLYWVNRAYSYRVAYDVAQYEYEQRLAKQGGAKLESV